MKKSRITRNSHGTITCVSGEIIPRHEVKGDVLFHLDHYESTTLTIQPEYIRIADNYFNKFDAKPSDPTMFELLINDKESISLLIQYFDLRASEDRDLLKSLYEAMERYAREERMLGLDPFGKLFKEIGVKFKGISHL